MSALNMAVIGVKGVGRQHIAGIVQHVRAHLVAVADLDVESGRAAAEKNQARFYSDYSEMLEKEQLDAVVIATPHHLHAPMTIDALQANLNVLVEKPLAIRV